MAKLSSIATLSIPAGEYTIRITDVEAGMSRENKPKISFKGEIIGGEHDRKKQFWSRSLVQQAQFKLASDLIAAGIDGDTDINFDDAHELAAELQEMVGKTYVFKVTERDYNGQTSNDFTLKEPLTDSDYISFYGGVGV